MNIAGVLDTQPVRGLQGRPGDGLKRICMFDTLFYITAVFITAFIVEFMPVYDWSVLTEDY